MTETEGSIFIGKCGTCKTTYRYTETVAGAHNGNRPNAPYCGCRADIGFPYTAIKFRMLKATPADRVCDSRCLTASSGKCMCSCGGRYHAMAHEYIHAA